MHERRIWLGGGAATYDPLLAMLKAHGYGEADVVGSLCGNPTFPEDKGTPIFDLVEHLDTAECFEVILKRLKQSKK